MDKYDHIINLPHHVSSKRPQMSMMDRAAQFSPFAALTGYDAAIQETGRLTDEKIELGEEEKAVLDRKQHYLCDMISIQPEITVTYFKPDVRKSGGTYVTAIGNLKRIDEIERVLILTDGCKIPLDVPFPVSWTVKMKKKQKETQDILSYHTQAAGCSDKARAKASGGRQPIEECGRTGL